MGLFRDSGLEIDKFVSNFDNGARPNRFSADFFAPSLGLNWEGLRLESCSFPGRTIETADFSEYGQVRKLPFNVNDGGTVDFTFLCDSSFADRFLIEAWQNAIYSGRAGVERVLTEDGEDTGTESTPLGQSRVGAIEGDSATPHFSYYNDYVGTVQITQLRGNGNPALRVGLLEAYPVSYAPMEVNSTSRDDVLRFTVSIAFRTFTTEYVADPAAGGLINRGRRILDVILDGLKVGSRYNSNAGKYHDRLSKLDEQLSKLGSIF